MAIVSFLFCYKVFSPVIFLSSGIEVGLHHIWQIFMRKKQYPKTGLYNVMYAYVAVCESESGFIKIELKESHIKYLYIGRSF